MPEEPRPKLPQPDVEDELGIEAGEGQATPAWQRGKLAERAEAIQRMMDERPGPAAYSRGARMRWLHGDLPGAIELMRLAAGATGNADAAAAAWIRVELGRYLMQARQVLEAHAAVQDALALVPDHAPALALRGRLLLADGLDEEAVRFLAIAAELNPLPEHQWALRDALVRAGREVEAERPMQPKPCRCHQRHGKSRSGARRAPAAVWLFPTGVRA